MQHNINLELKKGGHALSTTNKNKIITIFCGELPQSFAQKTIIKIKFMHLIHAIKKIANKKLR